MPTAVEQARDELQTALNTLAPDILGLQDFIRLPLQTETQTDLQALLTDYLRRQTLLQAAHDACVALLADGYPTLKQPMVDQTILADLDSDLAALTAARSRFVAKQPAVAGTVTFGTPTP